MLSPPRFWDAPPGVIAGLLSPLGLAWDAAGRLRHGLATPYRPPVPVVCVGNLVAGGAGKTPVVLSLAGRFAGKGVHIVTRGYGGRERGPLRVDPDRHDAAAVGDEALLLAAAAPCWVAHDRAAGARAAVAAGAVGLLFDDGMQNPSVAKTLSLLVVDAEYRFGNGRVMPAGPLREGLAAGLARADAVVLIGPAGSFLDCLVPVLGAELQPIDPDCFAGARLVAFAGIGRPAKFFALLERIGAQLVETHAFADHHRFRPGDLAALRAAARRADARLVTTRKDFVRLPAAERGDIDLLDVTLHWHDPERLAALMARAEFPPSSLPRAGEG